MKKNVLSRKKSLSEQKKTPAKRLALARSIIFFFNVFIGLMIISGSYYLIKTDFGKFSIIFGFSMLTLSVVLKVLKQW